MKEFDIVVIGGGPGGYVAAIRASQLGFKVAVVEKENLGGVCLNWGCIPTKALLRSAEVLHLMNRASEYGIKAEKISIDIQKIVARSRQVAETLSKGVQLLMKKNKIEVIQGHGRISGKNKITFEKDQQKQEINAKNIIIATGARARVIKGFEPNELIWTYKEAMVPKTIPKSLIIVGSGAIGIEFASFYRNMGSEVTILELQDRILPLEDAEIAKLAHAAFSKQGIKILTKANIKSYTNHKGRALAQIDQEGTNIEIEADHIITAIGIVPNSENLGLENTKVKLEKGHIVTNEWLATDEPGIYAIGDVTGAPWLAHKASHEAIICIEKIKGLKIKPLIKANIPGCIYSLPQIASIGMTEKQARDKGFKIKIGRFPSLANGKSIALGETEGLVKTIYDERTGELLGASMIGTEVTELIHNFVLLKTMEGTEEDIIHAIFPHPTLSEMLHESTLAAFDKALHI